MPSEEAVAYAELEEKVSFTAYYLAELHDARNLKQETNDQLGNMPTFGILETYKKISVSTRFSNKIAGLLKKTKKINDDMKFGKSHVSTFFCGVLEA